MSFLTHPGKMKTQKESQTYLLLLFYLIVFSLCCHFNACFLDVCVLGCFASVCVCLSVKCCWNICGRMHLKCSNYVEHERVLHQQQQSRRGSILCSEWRRRRRQRGSEFMQIFNSVGRMMKKKERKKEKERKLRSESYVDGRNELKNWGIKLN